MREKLFTLTRSQREDLWRRYKQTEDRRVAERLHAILLLDEGRSAHDVSAILHLHPKTLKRWIRTFATSGVAALCTFHYVGNTTSLDAAQLQLLPKPIVFLAQTLRRGSGEVQAELPR